MLSSYQIHKFLTSFSLIKRAGKIRSRSNSPLLFHSSHLHTHVLSLQNNHYA